MKVLMAVVSAAVVASACTGRMQACGVNRNSMGLSAATGTGSMKGVPVAMTGPLARLM